MKNLKIKRVWNLNHQTGNSFGIANILLVLEFSKALENVSQSTSSSKQSGTVPTTETSSSYSRSSSRIDTLDLTGYKIGVSNKGFPLDNMQIGSGKVSSALGFLTLRMNQYLFQSKLGFLQFDIRKLVFCNRWTFASRQHSCKAIQ